MALHHYGRSTRRPLPKTFIRPLIPTVYAMVVILGATTSSADVVTFGEFDNWTINRSDSAAYPSISPDKIKITNTAPGQLRSLFYNTPQTIADGFRTEFTYQSNDIVDGFYGTTFVIQRDARGPAALGEAPFQYGYGGYITPSAAISLEAGDLDRGTSSTALYTNGDVGGGSSITDGLDLFSGNPIHILLEYNAATTKLSETLTDTVTQQSFKTFYFIDLVDQIGGDTAFIGFTGGASANASDQYISNFRFESVPEASSLILMGVAGLGMAGFMHRRRKTRLNPRS